jgi:large subunit ribosomal protein L9
VKVILIKDVEKVGEEGEVVNVSDGYGRNYLMPRGLVAEATPAALAQNEKRLAKKRAALAQAKEAAVLLAEKLAGLEVKIGVEAGEEGKLFGSVTAQDIADKVREDAQIEIDRKKIHLEAPIKSLGKHRVQVKLHPEVVATLDLLIEPAAAK